MDTLSFAQLTTAAPPTISFEQVVETSPSLSQRIGEIWDQVESGISWFFGNMSPAGLWIIPTLALAVVFFIYFWKVNLPRKNSLEWIAMQEGQPRRLTLTLRRHPMARKDILPMLLLTAVYAFTAFFQLGNLSAPESYTVFDEETSYTFSYSDVVEVDKLSFFTVIGTGSYTLEYSADGETWASLELDQSYNTLLKWRINDLMEPEDEDSEAIGPIFAKMFRISAKEVDRKEGLWLGELVLWSGGNPLTPVYVDEGGETLFDEPEEWTDKSTYMKSCYFDEIYLARTALEHLNNVYPYEVSHPPLGKLILSLGILLFGMNPFGWRFMGTLVGVLMVPILYVFLKNLFGKTSVAFCGTCLFAFDFMHLVQTRIATIDSYGVFFILISYYFMYRWLTVPAGKKLRRSAPSLFLSGLFWGIGCASKWTVIYAGVGLALLWLLGLIFKGREWKELQASHPGTYIPRFGAHVAGTIALSVVFFVVVPLCIYIASYIPYAIARGGLTPENLLTIVWDNQVFMLTYHQGVHTPHPYESYWYQWIFDGRPILYYRDLSYSNTEGVKSLFASFNNPLVAWTGLLAFFAMVIEAFRKKSGKALFILIAILSQFVPWLPIGRILFAYHYFPTVLFLVFAVAYLMDRMLTRRRACYGLVVYGFTGYAAALYALFYPALIGLYTPLWYNSSFLRWMPSWPL